MKFRIIAVFAAACLAVGVNATAGACKADVQRFCGGVQDRDAILKCLTAHATEIKDAGCRTDVLDYQTKAKKISDRDAAVKKSCAADISKAGCKGDVGSGLLECLAKDPKALSDDCKDAFRPSPKKNILAKDAAIKKACVSEIATNQCAGDITAGLIKCVVKGKVPLSSGCAVALK